jgi:glutamyl aminopeptidase
MKDTDKLKLDIEKDMQIDIGLRSKEEADKLGIRQGDQITFDSPAVELMNNRLMGKALDNRLGLTVCLEVLKAIKDIELPFDIYVGTSVQEEVGLRGARTAAKLINPDFAIVVDVSPASDISKEGVHGKLGKGTIIRHLDAYVISNPKIID